VLNAVWVANVPGPTPVLKFIVYKIIKIALIVYRVFTVGMAPAWLSSQVTLIAWGSRRYLLSAPGICRLIIDEKFT
jgi:hypothetical protein